MTLVSKEGEKFPAHKLVLAVTRSYLKNEMRDNCSVIALKTVKLALIEALLSFMYEGTAVISENETNAFIETAKKWKIRQFLKIKKKKSVKPADCQSKTEAGWLV